MGFNGTDGIIEVAGSGDNAGLSNLLINNDCGRDIYMCTGINGGNIFMSDGDNGGNVIMCTGSNGQAGQVGIGTSAPAYKLDVCGTIRAKEIRVNLTGCDFVFENKYKLTPLPDLEKFIKENKHLPDIDPASKMETPEGVQLGEMNSKLLQKVEELTLYIIELNKRIVALEKSQKH